MITPEEKDQVNLPEEKIGVNEFAFAINKVLDIDKSKRLNGAIINNRLKALGILSEEMTDEGKKRTITNEKSEGYGIESITKYYNNREYQQVVINNVGKKFLLENIEKIMCYQGN